MIQTAIRLLKETDRHPRQLFARNFVWKGYKTVRNFKKRIRRGHPFFPAFLMISVTSRCNFSCRGCWVLGHRNAGDMSLDQLESIIMEAKSRGSFFFGILGGEPLLVKGLLELLGRHQDAYFLLFTNGSNLDDKTAATIRQLGNISPLISFEGVEKKADDRRGSTDVHLRTLAALENCRKNRIVFGTAVSLCKTNLEDLANESFLKELADRGAHYIWYYIYRPVGPAPDPELCLDRNEIRDVRRFLVQARGRAPLMVVDAYWDHKGRALCPGAGGLSHHINAAGDVELCPPLQYSADKADGSTSLSDLFGRSGFLKELREFTDSYSGACPLLEDPARLADFLKEQTASDSSGRGNFLAELRAMSPRPCHSDKDARIPEKSLLYRFMKKNAFFGWGAYG